MLSCKNVYTVMLLSVASVCCAQTDTQRQSAMPADTVEGIDKRVVRSLNQLLDKRDKHGKTDTLYLKRAPERIRLIAKLNASGSSIICKGMTNDGERYKTSLEAQNKYTLSLSASYRGLTLGVALNPARLAGKNKDYEFNMNAYGNRVGADVIFHSANTFKGTITTDNGTTDVPTGLVRQNVLYVNTYYVFNARRFSYAAAFSQSWLQRKSCGSFMLGLSFVGGNIRVDHSDELDNDYTRLSMANIGIGVGYGYNLVAKKKWLIHLSTLPQVVVFSRQRSTSNGERKTSPYRFPSIINVGHIAVIRHFNRYFAGFTAVVNTSSMGDNNQMRMSTIKWRGRFLIGIKL